MSVRGEFRRILSDLVASLREGEAASQVGLAGDLAPLVEHATEHLEDAAATALALLPRIDRAAVDPSVVDTTERLEGVCRAILGP